MNSVILFAEELLPDGSAVVLGERARYLSEFHDLTVGRDIRVGLWGGNRGFAKVTKAEANEYRFDCKIEEPALDRDPISLIVATPRPQILKRVIQAATLLGVKELNFIKSELSQKSYMQSSYFKQANLQTELIKALEQGCDTTPPEIKKWYSLEKYLEEGDLNFNYRIFGEEQGKKIEAAEFSSCVVAIGPEAGWSEKEKELLSKAEFLPITLGKRVLRVDMAVTAMVSLVKQGL